MSLLLALSSICVHVEAAKAPEWLAPLLNIEPDEAARKAGGMVLWDEAIYDYSEEGVVEEDVRWAVKILDRKHRSMAQATVLYEEDLSQIRNFRVWMVDPKGEVYQYKKKDAVDSMSQMSALHSTLRGKTLSLEGDVREGSVFAYEYTTKVRTIFSERFWYLNSQVPVLRSEIAVIPPRNWTAEALRLNGAKAVERRSGKAYVWESRDLPPFRMEADGPTWAATRPFLAVRLLPGEQASPSRFKTFTSWKDVALWDVETNDRQIEPDAAIRAKVEEICQGLSDDWQKVKAIAAYAQSVNYVSINEDVYQGGGYKPFHAREVFARHYGDCKDKTALMRSMLLSIGMESYAVSADAGDAPYVDPALPSPRQFNHCIVAIPVEEDYASSAVVSDQWLGKVMLFDPTSTQTPFGHLPSSLRDSYVLIGSDRTEGLTPVPPLEPQENSLVRELEIQLMDTGLAKARLTETCQGNQALRERRFRERRSESEYEEMLAERLSKAGSSVKVQEFSFEDSFQENRTTLSVVCEMNAYGRSMRGKFLVFKPFQIDQVAPLAPAQEPRSQPYLFRSQSRRERSEIRLPEGFEVDDFMTPALVETPFARYEASVHVVDGKLVCQRSITHHGVAVPPERYHEVVDYYERVSRIEQTPVVLALSE
ncbi:DUF3857 domain-containing protein [Pelagicoccus sp. SDUM812003]|uniref:DUF3857 domain-containing protein n=1 Tax=Pelagicoccus sp. SDUM812003 TaxID=3041267 RepID=UPI00280D3370|nr:DUF3857 domain-containing protein [Pelagicoccus sp. SDUM812003]MDQ8202363.1 DUF3857 domain-containing protein [Pelagicoccus sp. SDUM812003]